MAPRLAVGAVIFREDGAVLLVERGRPPHAGAWSLPGGKVVAGESLVAAVTREVEEETGLCVEPGPCIAVVTLAGEGYLYEIHDFVCELRGGETEAEAPRAGDDARDVRWCHERDLVALGVSDEVLRVIEEARSTID